VILDDFETALNRIRTYRQQEQAQMNNWPNRHSGNIHPHYSVC
jgi:hypothetical protein